MLTQAKRRRIGRPLTAVAVALAASLTLGSPLAASADLKKKPKPKRPDLVVTQNDLTSEPYLIQDERNTVSYVERTKNVGHAPAKVSYTWFGLVQSARSRRGSRINLRRVPALKPGESHGASQLSGPFTRHYNVPTGKLGRWLGYACADFTNRVREADEDNNCKSAGDIGIIPRRFRGPVDGTAPLIDGVKESFHASVTWVFDHVEGAGTYIYGLERADVDYTTSGTDSFGCTWSGHGGITLVNSIGIDHDYLRITYGSRGNAYFATAQVFNDLRYPVHATCSNGNSFDSSGPEQAQHWLETGGTLPLLPAHGYTALSDTSADSAGRHWDWRFDAD